MTIILTILAAIVFGIPLAALATFFWWSIAVSVAMTLEIEDDEPVVDFYA